MTQESKSEMTAIRVTPHEKSALRFVAGARRTSESELLRVMLLGDVVAEYERALDVLRRDHPDAA